MQVKLESMTLGNSETSAAKRNKVYVIEWRHSSGRWIPVWADQVAKFTFARKRRYAVESPSDKFRLRKYYAELEEVTDAEP